MAENSDWYAAAVVGVDSSLLFSEKNDFFHAGRALKCSFTILLTLQARTL